MTIDVPAPFLILIALASSHAFKADDPWSTLGAEDPATWVESIRGLDRAAALALFESSDEYAFTLAPIARDAVWRVAVAALAKLEDPESAASLVHATASELQDGGRIGEVRTLVGESLRTLPSKRLEPWLRSLLVEGFTLEGAWLSALEQIELAEASVDTTIDTHDRARCYVLGDKARLLLGLGVPDRAWFALEELDRAVEISIENGTLDSATWVATRMRRLDFRVALAEYAEIVRDVDSTFDATAFALDLEPYRPHLLHLRAIALARLAVSDPSSAIAAEAELRARLLDPSTSVVHRHRLSIELADLRLRRGDLEGADSALAPVHVAAGSTPPTLPRADVARYLTVRSQRALAQPIDRSMLVETLAEVTAGYDQLLDEWKSAPRLPGGVGFLHYPSRRGLLSELMQLTIAVRGAEVGDAEALHQLHRAQVRGSLALTLGAESIDLATLRSSWLTDSDHGALIYLPGPERTDLFVLDRETCRHLALAPLAELQKARDALLPRLMRRLGDDDAPVLARTLQEAKDAFVPSFATERIATWSKCTIVGAEHFGFVPFEALPVVGSEPLGWTHAIDYTSSAAVSLALERRATRQVDGPTFVLIAAPENAIGSGRPQPLPLPHDAIDALLVACGRSDSEVIAGADATADSLVAATNRCRHVLEILAHGDFDPLAERPAGILLAGSDVLRCGAAEQLAAPPLVVLATCGAARGPLRRGDDGVQHLGGAFLAAGARCVIVSHVDLDYDATLALLGEFHSGLFTRGETPAEALRRARRFVATRFRGSDPWLWSMIHATGSGHRAVTEARMIDSESTSTTIRVSVVMLGFGALVAWMLFWRTRRL